MAVIGQRSETADELNRVRDDLRRHMIDGGVTGAEVDKNLSILERFIDACIDHKLNARY